MPDIDRADDEDIVPEDPIISTSTKKPPPPPGPIPDFTVFSSQKPLNGIPQLPSYLNRNEPIELLDYFLPKEVVELITTYTNLNAKLHNNSLDLEITTANIYVYLGIYCYNSIQ
jgi:hypothetical protein